MPRDGSQIYHRPPGTDGIPDTTIASTPYNSYVADVEQDLNLPRPIVAGGTGATNARDAMTSLQGDVAYQIVTNYDSYPFISGSFYSAAGATSAPVAGHAFVGVCYTSDPAVVPPAVPASLDLVIEARDQNDTTVPGRMYVREKKAGVWGPWAIDNAALEAEKVNRSGDQMSGALSIAVGGSGINTLLALQSLSSASNTGAQIALDGYYGAALLQGYTLNAGASSAGAFAVAVNDGSNVLRNVLSATSTTLTVGVTLNANTDANIGGALAVADNLAAKDIYASRSANTGLFAFGNAGAASLYMDGTNIQVGGATFSLPFDPTTPTQAATKQYADSKVAQTGDSMSGALYIGTNAPGINTLLTLHDPNTAANSGAQIALNGFYNGAVLQGYTPNTSGSYAGRFAVAVNNASNVLQNVFTAEVNGTTVNTFLTVNGGLGVGGTITVNDPGTIQGGIGYRCRQGASGAFGGNYFNLFYAGGPVQLWIDSSNVGNITVTSDYRIKKDVIDLPGMWDTVKALRPIKYTQAQFSPPSHIRHIAEQTLKARKEAEKNPDATPREVNTAPLFPADDIERWGFIAHELQETLIPSAASGEKDSPDTIQSPNPFTLIAALTKALQEAMSRIEVLEAR